MDLFDNFKNKDFLEQISILNEVEGGDDSGSIRALFSLHASPLGDEAVDAMIRNCLRTLLSKHSEYAIEGLASENDSVRQLCVQISRENKLAQAGPILAELAGKEKDPDKLQPVLAAMAAIRSDSFLPCFKDNIDHPDPLLAGLCIEMIGEYQDQNSIPALKGFIRDNADEDRARTCEVTTWKAIEALSKMASPQSLAVLGEYIHHRNPTARRLIVKALEDSGERAIDTLARVLENGDVDERTMAANILGRIKGKRAADTLVDALDQGRLEEPNVRFAAYEALGEIPSLKTLVCLLDGLDGDGDESFFLAVVQALERMFTPEASEPIASILKQKLSEGEKTRRMILQAVVHARAFSLFKALSADPELRKSLHGLLIESNDPGLTKAFESSRCLSGPARLADQEAKADRTGPAKKLLAIDDSQAMLKFYQSAAGKLGFNVETAENGQAALDLINEHLTREMEPLFDVIIVDMNMPVLDGVEFTKRVRNIESYADTPVIMASTESAKSQARIAKSSGVTMFLSKPFTLDILRNKIYKALGL